MKKKLLTVSLCSLLLSVFSINTVVAQNVNYVQQREQLLQQKNQQNIRVGWFAGIIGDYRAIPMTQSFLPLSNYLDQNLKENMILVPDTSNPTIVKDALNGNYDMIYVTVNAALPLMKKNWIPIAQRTARIKPVILVLKNSNINNEQDLKYKKILGSQGVPITEYTKYHLYQDHIIVHSKDFIEKPLNQKELLSYLVTKQADAIIVLKKIALNLMQNNSNIKIIYNTPSAPGQMVLINPKKITPENEKILQNELLNMTPNMQGAKDTLTAINGYDFKENPFSPINEQDIQEAEHMVKFLKNLK